MQTGQNLSQPGGELWNKYWLSGLSCIRLQWLGLYFSAWPCQLLGVNLGKVWPWLRQHSASEPNLEVVNGCRLLADCTPYCWAASALEGASGGFALVSTMCILYFKILVEPWTHKVSRDASKSVYGMRKFDSSFADMLLLLFHGIGYF